MCIVVVTSRAHGYALGLLPTCDYSTVPAEQHCLPALRLGKYLARDKGTT